MKVKINNSLNMNWEEWAELGTYYYYNNMKSIGNQCYAISDRIKDLAKEIEMLENSIKFEIKN
jgi:hypothetical protein